MTAYLNLIWEEAYLAENGIISKTLWKIWQQEVVEVINTDFAKHIINKYKYHFPPNLGDKYNKKSNKHYGDKNVRLQNNS